MYDLSSAMSALPIVTSAAIEVSNLDILYIYSFIRLLCFAVTEQLDMNIKSQKIIKHIYNNTMQCNIIRGLHVVI